MKILVSVENMKTNVNSYSDNEIIKEENHHVVIKARLQNVPINQTDPGAQAARATVQNRNSVVLKQKYMSWKCTASTM